MEELIIYEFQAKEIEDTLRIVANILESYERKTCIDRDIMLSWHMIKAVLNKNIDEHINR